VAPPVGAARAGRRNKVYICELRRAPKPIFKQRGASVCKAWRRPPSGQGEAAPIGAGRALPVRMLSAI